ncbi:MAG: hypothetical protein D6696_10000 [Acidobacteria bacterium]|nr:MAG: hypothetical protein D6696_10000 [Acidobacteriota bacterium]
MSIRSAALPNTPSNDVEQLLHAVQATGLDDVDAVFLTRVLHAVCDMSRDLDHQSLTAAAAAPSDFEVLLRAVLQAQKSLVARHAEDRPLLLAQLRGQQARLALLELEGGTVPATRVAEILGISRQAVNKRRQAGKLLALPLGRHGFAYPVWQLAASGVLPGLEAVLERLRDHDPWMQARFFLRPNPRLGGATPLAVLRRGDVEAVLEAAAAYGEHGAA